jgi:hypothetical protein
MTDPNPRRPDFLPIVILAGILGLGCAAYFLFPYFQSSVDRQNCIAVGRTDCG